MTKELIQEIVAKPLIVVRQDGGPMYYLTRKGSVIIGQNGIVVTVYTAAEFEEKIVKLLARLN